jgi:hypothetical protein
VARLAEVSMPEERTRAPRIPSLLHHPAVLAVPGAVALIAGLATAPPWLQQVALGWFLAATGCAVLVLLAHGRGAVSEGEET